MSEPALSSERREIAIRIGYALTAAWMVLILVISGGDPGSPWFDLIFIVPLGGWIVAVTVLRLRAWLRNR